MEEQEPDEQDIYEESQDDQNPVRYHKMEQRKDIARALFGIGVGVAVHLFFIFLIGLFADEQAMAIAWGIGLGAVVYFGGVFYFVTVFVPAGFGIIMGNGLRSEIGYIDESPGVRTTTDSFGHVIETEPISFTSYRGFRQIHSQWERQAGFYFKFPWEYVVKPVDMERQIFVVEDKDKVYNLRQDEDTAGKKSGGGFIKIDWQIALTPLHGYIRNFNKMREEDIIKRIKVRAQAFLQGEIGKHTSITWDNEQQKALKVAFEKLFGGEEVIDREEKQMGVWTGTPEIFEIGPTQSSVSAIQTLNNITAIADSAKKAKDTLGDELDVNMAFRNASILHVASQPGAKVDFIEIAGMMGGGGGGRGNNKGNRKKGGNRGGQQNP